MKKKLFGSMKHQADEDFELEDFDLMDMDEEFAEESIEGFTEEFAEDYTEDTAEDFSEEYTEDAEIYEEDADFEEITDDAEIYEEDGDFEDITDDAEFYAADADMEEAVEEAEIYEDDVDIEEITDDAEFYEEDDSDFEELDVDGEPIGTPAAFSEEEDEEDEILLGWGDMPDKNIFQKIWYSLVHMSAMDRVITTTGVFILILALVAGTLYVDRLHQKKGELADAELAVGTQLDGITVVGEKGLLAVSDSEKSKYAIADGEEGEDPDDEGGYDENDYIKDVTVSMNLTSVEKDLKVKFVNKDTNKLIANVPFEIEVRTPDKKTEVWTDDDMDGIIYKASITPGNYTVTMKELTDEKYASISFDTESRKVEVKKEIAYQKIDVSDEIKKDSEVAAGEDGGKDNGNQEESGLQDTVAWVESTRTVIEEAYTPVDKKTITDPLTAAVTKSFMRMGSLNLPNMDLKVNEVKTITLPQIDGVNFETPTYTVADPGIAFVQGNNVVGSKAGSTTITVSVVGTKAADASGGNETQDTYSGTFTVTVTSDVVAVTGVSLSESKLSLTVGNETNLAAIVTPENATNKELTWSSSDESVVKVEYGKVTALKAGSAIITVASVADPTKKATCTVTVTAKAETRTLSVDPTTLSLALGSKAEIKATVKNSDASGSVSGVVDYKVDKTDILDIVMGSESGGVTPFTISAKKNGTATITFTLRDTNLTAKCKVTVSNRTMKLEKTSMSVLAGGKNTIKATVGSTSGEFKAESSAKETATVTIAGTEKDNSGNLVAKVEVTGVKAGSATITVVHSENGTEIKQTFAVTVIAKDTKLTDKNKQQYYVQTGTNQYREATYADYYDASITTLYLKTEGKVKYTGWQTIDGKRYYFDANGKYVTGEQVIQGAKYTFASDGVLITGSGNFGIDVSKWNGNIDWTAVKNSGVDFVIIRSGYRGSSQGSLVADPKFEANIKGANAAGLKVGIYFFSQAVNKTEAVEEASMVLQQVKNYKISYPIFIDVEEVAGGGRANNIDKATRTEVIKAFCQTIQNSGYTAGVYANKSWLTEKIDTSQLGSYKIWLAQYAAQPTYSGRYDMWQYKKTGKINGISGDVDLNMSYLGY